MPQDVISWIAEIFDPALNPYAPKRNNDNVEDAEIIEEVHNGR